jgi:hypothetical protein
MPIQGAYDMVSKGKVVDCEPCRFREAKTVQSGLREHRSLRATNQQEEQDIQNGSFPSVYEYTIYEISL